MKKIDEDFKRREIYMSESGFRLNDMHRGMIREALNLIYPDSFNKEELDSLFENIYALNVENINCMLDPEVAAKNDIEKLQEALENPELTSALEQVKDNGHTSSSTYMKAMSIIDDIKFINYEKEKEELLDKHLSSVGENTITAYDIREAFMQEVRNWVAQKKGEINSEKRDKETNRDVQLVNVNYIKSYKELQKNKGVIDATTGKLKNIKQTESIKKIETQMEELSQDITADLEELKSKIKDLDGNVADPSHYDDILNVQEPKIQELNQEIEALNQQLSKLDAVLGELESDSKGAIERADKKQTANGYLEYFLESEKDSKGKTLAETNDLEFIIRSTEKLATYYVENDLEMPREKEICIAGKNVAYEEMLRIGTYPEVCKEIVENGSEIENDEELVKDLEEWKKRIKKAFTDLDVSRFETEIYFPEHEIEKDSEETPENSLAFKKTGWGGKKQKINDELSQTKGNGYGLFLKLCKDFFKGTTRWSNYKKACEASNIKALSSDNDEPRRKRPNIGDAEVDVTKKEEGTNSKFVIPDFEEKVEHVTGDVVETK